MKKFDRKNFMTDEKKRFLLRIILLSAPIIAFFVAVILSYYDLLYTNARDDIINDGQTASIQSMDYIHDHLSRSENAVKLIAYTIDDMMKENRSNSEILEYLKRQSTAVSNTVFEDMTGIHGYINGEFLDAITWTPDADFVATKRPWYTNAIEANDGDVAITSPHFDRRTGKIVMAVSKKLSDGKSVVAININLDTIQNYAEKNAASGKVDHEFILDSRNRVVVHSDRNEVGKDYSDETYDFWNLILTKAKNTDENFFEFDYNDEHYIVYSEKMDDEWHYLSVKDATGILNPLKRFLVIAIAIAIVIVLWLSYMANKANQKYNISRRINEELSSISNIYLVVYDFDIINDTFKEIKSGTFEYDELSKNENQSASSVLKSFISQKVDANFISDMFYFVDMHTLNERLKNTETIEMEYQNRTGKWRRVRFIATQRLRNNTVTRVLWLIEDINREKTEMNFSEHSLDESEAKYTFLSNVSDEILTSLNVMIGMNDIILHECEESEILTYSESIKTAGQTLLELVNNILDFSKIEAGKIEVVPVDYDLSSLINDLVNMIQIKADGKGLALDLDFDRDMPKMLHGDEIRIKQIITNMLVNAVKYTEKGSITFSVGFKKIEDDPNNVIIMVSVKDTGVGIKVEEMKKLFTGFKRIKETHIRNIDNISLDMTITQNLLYLMGSTLQVESVYGFGTKFSFELKQSVVEWIPLGNYDESYKKIIKTNKKHKIKFTAPKAQILVIDDNPMNLMMFKNMLKFTKIKIDMANNGEEGLLMTQGKKYDIIFLDHMMPKKNGIETLHELRTQELRTQVKNPNLYTIVVCLTANTVSGARELYLEEGFDDYLSKPIELEKLEEMLMSYLPKEKIDLVKNDNLFE